MTEELFSPARPAVLLSELQRWVADATVVETRLPRQFGESVEAIRRQYAHARAECDRRYEEEKSAAQQQYASLRPAVEAQYQREYAATQQEYQRLRGEILAAFDSAEKSQTAGLREAQWEATTVFEASKNNHALQVKEIEQRLAKGWHEIDALHEAAISLLRQRGHWHEPPQTSEAPPALEGEPLRRFADLVAQAHRQWQGLETQPLALLTPAVHVLGVLVSMAAVAIPLVGLLAAGSGWLWLIAGGVVAAAIVLLTLLLARSAERQSLDGYRSLRQTWADAGAIRQHALQTLAVESQRYSAALVDGLNAELRKADSAFGGVLAEASVKLQEDLEEADAKYPALLADIAARRDRRLQETDAAHVARVEQIESAYRSGTDQLAADHAREVAQSEQENRRNWDALAQRRRGAVARFGEAIGEINAFCDRLFPSFDGQAADVWKAATSVPPVVRVGKYELDLSRIEGGIPADERLRPQQTRFALPALLPFPERSTLLLEPGDDQSPAALQIIQAVMLRMLTAYPPAKLQFTIIDPVGLGESFAAFMHLADYDEKLVGSRIWTDPQHIEQRLADLGEHMENVIQLFLRNEFETIQQYNASAGEVAEPYRVLVVAGFPANFSDAAVRRLTSIVNSGARCGVFTILSLNPRLRMPRELQPKDIEPHALRLCCREGEYCWTHPDVGALSLVPDPLPAPARFTELVRAVGQAAKSAAQVEVPFAAIAPAALWTADAREGVDVPLGRAGARKLQHLRLGKGTSQHVLISGKSGSGKSTLLHVLVTSLALRYSPDEVELYLVDFKKGVEFKAYASCELPHARVIAIESEREFGLSVLECLDAELQRRGDLFRNHSVQDLKGFRAAAPGVRVPRAMLVVDEFQELFVEDDRLSQDAALLLDRLVRQGRAFGIHVLLGSQTLAGAYSLPRSTIGQMAVRIALQCSEADAHLILSEDNTAARLLSRPGEAIYNNANGLFEGNHPFQVVWLSEAERDQRLQQIRRLAHENGTPGATIVFEGNAAADIRKNQPLAALLATPTWPDRCPAPRVWLGAPVAIKEATSVELPRQSGSNLLVVGHRGEAALGMLAAAVVGLAAQHTPGTATKFVVLDGTPADAEQSNCWSRLRDSLPHELLVAGVREAAGAIAGLAAEVSRRLEAAEATSPPLYLVVCNLSRFRELRKGDDDFGYSRAEAGAPPSTARQFADILCEGPAVGVHTLLWCDTYNTVHRFFDRRVLSEFDLRVVFHMAAADSSSLIESPLASQLGAHRAILYHAAEAWQEKFCPYGFPPHDWLGWVKSQLAGRMP